MVVAHVFDRSRMAERRARTVAPTTPVRQTYRATLALAVQHLCTWPWLNVYFETLQIQKLKASAISVHSPKSHKMGTPSAK